MTPSFASQEVRVRFAPSPTGKLHIGGARTALYNWAFARHMGGTFVLRIDDTDPERSTAENTQIILDAMNWLGLTWDEGPGKEGDFGPYFQTERFATYQEALEQLKAKGLAYPCFCTPEELAAAREKAQASGEAWQGYSRICRDMDPAEAQARIDAGEPHAWRIKVPLDCEPIEFVDAVHERTSVDVSQLDDFVIVRSDGTPTYNFATVVDDALMKITHIIRGDDHLSNTPRQIVIYEALGYPVPQFAHLSMILGPDGKRLSKRHGATSVGEYQDRGLLPEALLNYLALLGWSLDGETTLFDLETLAKHFDLTRISKNPAVFDDEKLAWMNGEYLKALDKDAYVTRALLPALTDAGLASRAELEVLPKEHLHLMAELVRERAKLIPEIAEKLGFLFAAEPLAFDETSVQKQIAKNPAEALRALERAREVLADLSETDWQVNRINEALDPLPEELDLKKKIVFQALRVATTANQVSPPLTESWIVLGKDRTIRRIDDAIAAWHTQFVE